MKKSAIILGATGLTGSALLKRLIDDERYGTIKLFSRSKIKDAPKKIQQFVGDLLKLEDFKPDFTADEVYCCIGTTTKKTPDKKLYKHIDYGIPVAAAKLAHENGIPTFLVISAMGAHKKSNVFYTRTKGEMEHAVLKYGIRNTYILRPALIGGERNEYRIGEKIGLTLLKILQPLFIGGLKKYKIIDADCIAQAMVTLANNTTSIPPILKSDEIKQVIKNNC